MFKDKHVLYGDAILIVNWRGKWFQVLQGHLENDKWFMLKFKFVFEWLIFDSCLMDRFWWFETESVT